jgi:hypothetical protein
VIPAAKPNLSVVGTRELEELLIEYGDIFVMDSNNYRQTDSMYHHIGRGGPTNLPTPKETPHSKTGGCG